jgi:hypothetical protein
MRALEARFATSPGEQARVDLARFEVEPFQRTVGDAIVRLFSMVLGHLRLIWATFVVHTMAFRTCGTQPGC